jgi:phage virion morphogenesis protein
MLSVTIDTRELKQMVKQYKSRLTNLEPPLKGFGQYLLKETQDQFKNQTDPEGKRWAELKEKTLLEKQRKGYPSDILTRTGDMQKKLYYEVSNKSLEFGIKSPIAEIHQDGVPSRNLPQRRIVGITKKRLQYKQKLVLNYIKGRKR